MPRVEIKVGTKDYTFECDQGENLLFEARARSIPIPFRCTSARCGTCRIEVMEGAEHLNEMGEREALRLGEEGIEKNQRLACQLFVEGDIRVEVPQPKLF